VDWREVEKWRILGVIVDRRCNGNETDHGLWFEPDAGVIHAVMCH